MQQTDMEKSILPNQPCQLNLANSILAKSSQVPENLATLTNVGHHKHQVQLATHQVQPAKSKE